MDHVIMPELITPKFAEIIAENPELLKSIFGQQPDESVVVGQDCTVDLGENPTNVKLVLCNVTIDMGDSNRECHKGNGTCESVGLSQLELEVAVLEAKIAENLKILRLIPKQTCNRKLIARCKININETLKNLALKKKRQ